MWWREECRRNAGGGRAALVWAACGCAAVGLAAVRRSQISDRARRRCGSGAVVCGGFDKLPLRGKGADLASVPGGDRGRDIYYDQRYAHNLEMRDVLEEIITHPDGIDAATLAEIQRYTKLFWINSGPYNNLTARKFVLKCTPAAFAAAAAAAARTGRRSRSGTASRSMPCSPACSRSSSTRVWIPSSRTRRQDRARTSSQASANNLYVGVTMNDLRRVHRAVPAQLAPREAERQARRRGVPRRRQVRRADPGDRRASRGGNPVRHGADGESAARADEVLSDRRDRRPRGLRHRLGRRTRTRRSTRSTGSSRSTWTRAASRARGKRWCST